MDINALMSSMLSKESVQGLSKATGATQKDVKNVLASALPALLSGAEGQAKNESTAAGFAGALSDHAKADTSDLTAFLANVDMEDGGKILGHLLGADAGATTERAAGSAGLNTASTGLILAAVAPLLMSLLGQQANQDNSGAGIGSLMGSLLGGADTGSLLTSLLGGGSAASAPAASSSTGKKKKKKPAGKKDDQGGGLLDAIIGLLK